MTDLLIQSYYTEPTKGLSSWKQIYEKMIEDGYIVTKKEVKDVLDKIPSVQLTKYYRKKSYKTMQIPVHIDQKPFNNLSVDLAELYPIETSTRKQYLLCVIDNLTRYAFVRLLKNKTSEETKEKMNDIIDEIKEMKYEVKKIYSDKGKEFSKLHTIDPNIQIIMLTTKAYMVERFIRTLKQKIMKYLTLSTQHKLNATIYNQLVTNYNNSKHSFINMSPVKALKNYKTIIDQYIEDNKVQQDPKYSTGDIVKISRSSGPFMKEQNLNWSIVNYMITHAYKGNPPYYRLQYNELDYDILRKLKDPKVHKVDMELDIQGVFYEEELQLVSNN